MKFIEFIKKHVKKEFLKGKKELKNYTLHKEALDTGVKMSGPGVIDSMEKDGARSVYLDHFYAMEDVFCKLTGESPDKFHEINRKEFGRGSKYRR